jgi:hypothetical protein
VKTFHGTFQTGYDPAKPVQLGRQAGQTYNANPSGRGVHPSYGTEGYACADIRGDLQLYSKRQLAFDQIKKWNHEQTTNQVSTF